MTSNSISEILPLLTTRKVPWEQYKEIKALLTAYSAAIPHHDIEDFGDFGELITIDECFEEPMLRLPISTLFCSRKVDRVTEAHNQEADFPESTLNETNIDKWSIPFDLPNGFVEEECKVQIPESCEIIPCSECNGNCKVPCKRCNQHGFLACDVRANCPVCDGRGTVTHSHTVRSRQTCRGSFMSPCEGGLAGGAQKSVFDPSAKCLNCGGTGMADYEDEEYYEVTCQNCSGQGQVVCPVCGGAGKVRCETCDATGMATCESCKGNGTLLTYLTVFARFEPAEKIVELDCSEPIISKTCDSDWQKTYKSEHDRLKPEFVNDWSPQILQKEIQSYLQECIADESEDKHIVKQMIEIQRACAISLKYQYRGNTWKLWLVGKDKVIYASPSPFTEFAKKLFRESIQNWKQRERKLAVEQLRQVWEIQKADSCCDFAIKNEVSEGVPAGLMTSALASSAIASVKSGFRSVGKWFNSKTTSKDADVEQDDSTN